jgi:hypothetical protein
MLTADTILPDKLDQSGDIHALDFEGRSCPDYNFV